MIQLSAMWQTVFCRYLRSVGSPVLSNSQTSYFLSGMAQNTIGSEKIISELVNKLADRNPYIRAAATWALTELDKQSKLAHAFHTCRVKYTFQKTTRTNWKHWSLWQSPNWMTRGGLFGSTPLWCWKSNPCWIRYMTMVRSTAHWVAQLNWAYLQEKMTIKSIAKLVEKLTDNDEDVRAEAIRAFKIFGTQCLLTNFTLIYEHPCPHVVFSCISGDVETPQSHW